ncbi:putative retrotransposon hot spot (RHS) protein [Trypanosoma cruzi]|nr:putative retrotransposon hot spot (RHS) protein [Trypanosoma cruzi]
MPHPLGGKSSDGSSSGSAKSWIILPLHPTVRHNPRNRRITEVAHVSRHRLDGLVKQKCSIRNKVNNHLEFLHVVLQQLVEEVQTGSHRLPDLGRPNQHTPLGRKVGRTVSAEPFG